MTVFSHPEYSGHERVVFHEEPRSGLRAIVAIHDRTLGPAIGGCRMFPYASDAEALTDVLRLSKAMTWKCAMARIPFGGGKAVVIGDPAKEKTRALLEAVGDLVETFAGDYVTAYDSGTSLDDLRVIRTRTAHVGGIAEGHGNASRSTAIGVLESLRVAARRRLEASSLAGVSVAIQGVGNVGIRLAELLRDEGALVFVTDVDRSRLEDACDKLDATAVAPDEIYALDVDVFSPCALGGTLDAESVDSLRARAVVGGANNQLANPSIARRLDERGILYAPDYVVNAGGIIDIHHQLHGGSAEDLRRHLVGIGDVLGEVFERASAEKRPTSEVADTWASELVSAGR